MKNLLAYIVGICCFLIFIYRIFALMIPMLHQGINNNDIPNIFRAFTLLV